MKHTVIGEIPEDWEVSTLGEFGKCVRGVSYKPDDLVEGTEESVVVLRSNNISERTLNFTEVKFVTPKNVSEKQILRNKDIAICMSNGSKRLVGKSARYIEPKGFSKMSVGAFCSIFRAEKSIQGDFIFQLFQSDLYQKQIDLELAGSAINNLKDSSISGLTFGFPPLAEQQKIAEILSTVDEKMAVMDEQLAQTQELKKGLMQRLLTKGIGHTAFKDSPLGPMPENWVVKELREVGSLVGGCAFSAKLFNDTGDGYQVVRMSNVQAYGLELKKSPVYMSLITQKEERYLLQAGDVLITLTGTLGKRDYGNVAFIKESNKLLLNQRVGRFKYEDDLVGKYIFFVFHSAYFREEFFSSGKGGTGNQANVGKSDFESIKIAVPPLSEQHQIAEVLTAVDDKLQVLTDKKTQYQELKLGLMQQLLTGKRRVRIPQDETVLA